MPGEPRLSSEQARRSADKDFVDGLCDRFEKRWKTEEEHGSPGDLPGIEELLAEAPLRLRSEALRELLIVDIDHRLMGGEIVEVDEYRRRFPDDLAEIEHAWKVIRAEYEPDTARGASGTSPDERPAAKPLPAALPALDGRRYFPRNDWSVDSTAGRAEAQDTIVMSSELTSVEFHKPGGLGFVCLARDQRLNRSMALKFIRRRWEKVAAFREQLRLEAEITSRLEHPGVVPVYGVGETSNGRLFYAMRFIQGETLDAAIDRFHQEAARTRRAAEHDTTMRALLAHFVAVCKTVAYAHTRGIVHRDIKPANIMLGRYGETTLVDWGLAIPVGREGPFKVTNEETIKFGSGSRSSDSSNSGAGTPAYMSPEQAACRGEPRPSSDVYSLGATLYKLMTGVPPFSGPLESVRERVARGAFRRPTELNKGASKALEAICLKAMSVEPYDRYETALELAQDVECFLGDADITAYQEPPMRRIARWARRHWASVQVALIALALLATSILVAAILFGRMAHREGAAKTLAEASQTEAEASRQKAVALQLAADEMRKQSLSTSAEFAAQMIGNQVDIRWGFLEKLARDARLHESLKAISAELNAQGTPDPQRQSRWAPLQNWLNEMAAEHRYVRFRSVHVNAVEGTQVARYPSTDSDGKPVESIGQNFSYRDYFHGSGRDRYEDKNAQLPPLTKPHISAAIESTLDAELAVAFSVPVRDVSSSDPIGVLAMTVALGDFAALRVELPPGQRMLLVESRDYDIRRGKDPDVHDEPGRGLVLYHEALKTEQRLTALPHVDDATLAEVAKAKALAQAGGRASLLPFDFTDPVTRATSAPQDVACAPVIISSRPGFDTGWFVIIPQAQGTARRPTAPAPPGDRTPAH